MTLGRSESPGFAFLCEFEPRFPVGRLYLPKEPSSGRVR